MPVRGGRPCDTAGHEGGPVGSAGTWALLGLIETQNQFGAQLTAMMVDVDRWLCTLMDPAQRTFELKELIARHGWPDVDLREIEMDEL